ncbi:MAG: acetolactate decarboxylase [Candidatus Sumerlaeia bacterium]|nr:acetolactate decarboxylase [Candidatus Sumerlaeia bacterium]
MILLTRFTALVFFVIHLVGCAPVLPPSGIKSGQVSYLGEQRTMFETGRADSAVQLSEFEGVENLYAIGPVAGLDGEITILDSKPHISQIRGEAVDSFSVDHTFNHDAIFLVWAELHDWHSPVNIPESVTNYDLLEDFVFQTAASNGIDITQPFAFQIVGRAKEIVWHINVDRTQGEPVTRELFRKSKESYTLRDEEVEIFGVYSENHGGVFMSQGLRIHIHFASFDSSATGHIDSIDPRGLNLRFAR